MDLKDGAYKGRVIKAETTIGMKNDNPEMILQVAFADGLGTYGVALSFSPAASPYSLQRLRAAGCKAEKPEDIWGNPDFMAALDGIDANEIDLDVTHEVWEKAKGGDDKTRMKINIRSGGGSFKASNPTDWNTFRAKVAALSGAQIPTGAGIKKPDF